MVASLSPPSSSLAVEARTPPSTTSRSHSTLSPLPPGPSVYTEDLASQETKEPSSTEPPAVSPASSAEEHSSNENLEQEDQCQYQQQQQDVYPLLEPDINGLLHHRASLPGIFPHNYHEKSIMLGSQHRNSIAGSTVPRPLQRPRKSGPLVISSEGPYFSNTTQFYNLFNMNQTESYKVKVMARIEKGFFMARGIWTCYRRNYFQVSTAFAILGFDHSRFSEAPCFIELPDPLPPDFDNEIRQEQDFAMSQAANEQQSANFVMDHSMCTVGLNKTGYGNMGAVPSIDQHTSMAATSGPNRLAMVTHFSISISSKIANTSTQIGLIQHTPKRDKGPQNVPSRREIRGGGNFSLPITNNTQTISTFERVQFKTATANNGKRRAAQQFYILIVDLFAHTQDGHIIRVAASQSDSLVVRGRSPGHYIDNPEGDMMLSPTLDSYRERRHSSMSSQSSFHPYHNTSQYFGGHNGSQGISAGAGISVEMSTLSLGLSTTADGSRSGGPLSPIFNSPDGHGMGLGGDYSPSIAATSSFYPNFTSTHQGWTDASSMSSPASTYEGSTFSSPTMAYPAFQQYQNDQQPSPQENGYQHPNQSSYFAQRPSNYGSIPSMMMVGTPGAGISPGHSFDGRLETTVENSYESDGYGQSQMGYQQQQHPFNTPAAIASEQALYTSRPSDFPGFGGYPHQQPSSVSVMPMIKSEFDDSLKYTSTASPPILMQQRPAINNHFTHSDMKDAATPGSTTATTSSVSSSFGYTLQDMESSTTTDGNIANPHQLHHHQHQHHSYLPSVPLNDSVGVGMRTKDLNSAAPGYVPPRNVNIKLEQE